MKRIILLTTAIFLSTAVLAGGSIFGGHSKSKNYNGVKALAVELCGVDKCPKFRILEGDCDTEHTYKRYGTCLCEEGYVPKEGKCEPCPDGYYSDGQHECTKCGPGEYSIKGSIECGTCKEGTYSPGGKTKCYECPENANCTHTSFSCKPGFHSIGGSYETLKCIPDCPSDAPYWNGLECVQCTEDIHCGKNSCYQHFACIDNMCVTSSYNMYCIGGVPFCDTTTNIPNCVECYNEPDGTCVGCSNQYPVCTDDHHHKICTSDTECPEGWECAIDNSFGYTGCYEPCPEGVDNAWYPGNGVLFHDCCPSDAPYWNGAACVECLENIHCGNDCSSVCTSSGVCALIGREGCGRIADGGLRYDIPGYCDTATNTYHHPICQVECYHKDDGTCVGCTDQYPVCTDDHHHKICTSDTECPSGWKCAIDNPFGYRGCYEPCEGGKDYWGAGMMGVPHQCSPNHARCETHSDCGSDCTYYCGDDGVCKEGTFVEDLVGSTKIEHWCNPSTNLIESVECYNKPDGTCVGCSNQYPVCTDDHYHQICTSDTECPTGWKCAIDNPFGYRGCYEPCEGGLSDVWTGMSGMPTIHACCPAEKPVWDGSECVECTKDEHCDTGYMCDKQECKARECDIETYPRTTPPQNCTKYATCVSPTETRYSLCQQCQANTIWYNNECSISKGKCPPGFYCPEDGCPDGYWCPGGPDPIPCPEGKYCPEGSIAPTPCPAGSYCPAGGFGGSGGSWGGGFDFGGGGASGYLTCPEKYFCPAGTVTPIDCPADYYCEGETVEPIPCPQGYYCPPRTCIPIECGPSPWIGKWPTGCYLPCVNGAYTIPEGQSRGSCVCTEGWTGTLCDIEACDTTEYPLTEKPDEGAYTFETCEDTVKHYKKTGCTATHIDEDSNGICINKCEAKANAHDKICETCSVDELGNVTIAPVVSRTTCTNPDGETGNTDYVCATNSSGRGVCKDPCTIGAHADFVATTCFTDQHAENGRCVPTYADTETSCINPLYPGVGSFCDGYGECGCPDGKMYSPILQQCVVPSGTGCKSNSGCDIGQFCEVTSYSSSAPNNTQCQSLDYLPNETFEIQTVNGRKKVIHTTSASQAKVFKWDTGLNWCKAQGGRLASLTDFGITHCNDSGKSLSMCASTTVYVKGANGNYTKWSDYYNTLSADDKYNWNKLTTYNWMSEPYNKSYIYEFNPSTGSIAYHTYSHSCDTLYHILCILDDDVSCPTNSSYRKTPPSGSEEPTSVSHCYCNTATPHWNNSKNSCVACNQETDCATGYVCTNNACQPRDCSAFPLNACDSTHGTCDTCQSASVPKYKLTCDTGYYKTSDSATSCTECKTDSTATCSSCPAETPFWTGENCVACDETIEIPQTATFAHDTPKGATELIAELGPYKCAYDVYVKGSIDDTFLITDMDGNTLCGGDGSIGVHNVDGVIYRIMPNTQIKIYALDHYGTYLAWELYSTSGGRTGTPAAPILELRRVQSAENYCKGSQL